MRPRQSSTLFPYTTLFRSRLNELTQGKGPEKCIDAVGMEAHATATIDSIYDRAKQMLMLETDRPHVLREIFYVCRPAGTDRKSTRLNSSHPSISYAVFCLK